MSLFLLISTFKSTLIYVMWVKNLLDQSSHGVDIKFTYTLSSLYLKSWIFIRYIIVTIFLWDYNKFIVIVIEIIISKEVFGIYPHHNGIKKKIVDIEMQC